MNSHAPPDQAVAPQAAAPGAPMRRRASVWQSRGGVLSIQVGIILLMIAGMQALNSTSGNLIMPAPGDVLRQSLLMWADGTMLKGLGQTLGVLDWALRWRPAPGYSWASFWADFPLRAECWTRSSTR